MEKEYDVFVGYVNEDKDSFVSPLINLLQKKGLKVRLAEFELILGDSLSRKIEEGFSESKFGVVIVSPNFLKKDWPEKELDYLAVLEDGKDNMILPIWHEGGFEKVRKYSPMLADKLSISYIKTLQKIAEEVYNAVNPSVSYSEQTTRLNHSRLPVVSTNVKTEVNQNEKIKKRQNRKVDIYESLGVEPPSFHSIIISLTVIFGFLYIITLVLVYAQAVLQLHVVYSIISAILTVILLGVATSVFPLVLLFIMGAFLIGYPVNIVISYYFDSVWGVFFGVLSGGLAGWLWVLLAKDIKGYKNRTRGF